MTSTPQPVRPPHDRQPNYGRRIRWLGLAVVLFCILYAAGWFWAARQLEAVAAPAVANAQVECSNLQSGGFPFRIGLFCDRTGFADQGVVIKAGAFRSAAQVYNPTTVVGELDGPARVEAPGLPPLELSWSNLRASSHLANPVPTQTSLDARNLRVSGPNGLLATADDAQAHVRLRGQDIDVAASVLALVLPALPNGGTLPAANGQLVATLANGVADLALKRNTLRGRSGSITTLELALGPNATLSLSGPFSVDEDGLLDAEWTVAATNPERLAQSLASVFPEKAQEIRTALAGLAVLGSSASLPLRVENGEARLAFVTLGDIPPLQ